MNSDARFIKFNFSKRFSPILFFALFFAAFSNLPATAQNALPHLDGAKAVDYLKEKNLYDSLADAVAANANFVQQAKLQADEGRDNVYFGNAVAISGDTAIVAKPRDQIGTVALQGSAYIFVRTGTTWALQQKLTASDGAMNDQFGYSVAINGNTAAVGRYNTTTGQNRADGKVYVFTRTGTTWTETQTLVSNDIAQGDLFGNSLALENDTLVVGALNKTLGSNFFQGAVYVFTRPGAGSAFTQQQRLTAADGGFADFFGYSVAVSGDTIIVGAVGTAGQPNSVGKAYVFTRSGSNWTQQQKLTASDGEAGDAFGFAVGVSGDYAVIGARLDTINGVGAQGSAYVFVRSGATWTEQQKLIGVEPIQRNDNFGYAVAIKGDTIVIGSPAHEFLPGIANHGAIYVFTRSGTTWTRQQKLVHSDASADGLGLAVAFDGTSIIGGAPSKDANRGAAYVFAPDIFTQQQLTEATAGNFGHSVSVEGDTMVIGASTEMRENPPNGFFTDGAAYVYVRNGSNWVRQARLVAPDAANGRQFGESVAISGNTIVVGAFTDRIGTNQSQGSAYVFVRNGANWDFQQKLTASDGAGADWFGEKVAVLNDTIAVGAYRDDIGANQDQGSVYVFTRTNSTWSQATKITANDGAAFDVFGRSVSLSGNSLLVGATGDDNAKGSAYVYTGSGANWTLQQKITAADGASEDEFGKSVSISGETALVSAYGDDIGTANAQGSAYIFVRSGTTWTQQTKLTAADGAANDWFGFSAALYGDRAVIGANFDDIAPNTNNGSAYVFFRSGTIWSQQSKLMASNADNGDEFGFSVAINGGTIAVGADEKSLNMQGGVGATYVFTDTSAPLAGNRAIFDFDGDGKADLSVFRSGNWYVSRSSNNQFSATSFGLSSDRLVPADYDGDGKTDVAVYRGGNWYLLNSTTGFSAFSFGNSTDVPVPADYDGDGKADIAVFRDGVWYRINSSNNQFAAVQFGTTGDKPVRGDFDGDGKADVAVFRSGAWYILNSSNNQFRGVNWGLSSDKLVPADYDGDGKTDLAVFREGNWYILNSSNNQLKAISFGVASDVPTPADYDGDGKADVAVYRDGNWFILNSSNNSFRAAAFGIASDVPIPSVNVR